MLKNDYIREWQSMRLLKDLIIIAALSKAEEAVVGKTTDETMETSKKQRNHLYLGPAEKA